MRDFKCTLGEYDVIVIDNYSDRDKRESAGTLFDITKRVPEKSIFTKEAIECGLYNLDTFIQCHLQGALKWETIILIFSNLGTTNQSQLICDYADHDTLTREDILDKASQFLIGRPWPTYGSTQEEKDSWKLFMTAAMDKYSRPAEYY